MMVIAKPSETLIRKTTHLIQDGMRARAFEIGRAHV